MLSTFGIRRSTGTLTSSFHKFTKQELVHFTDNDKTQFTRISKTAAEFMEKFTEWHVVRFSALVLIFMSLIADSDIEISHCAHTHTQSCRNKCNERSCGTCNWLSNWNESSDCFLSSLTSKYDYKSFEFKSSVEKRTRTEAALHLGEYSNFRRRDCT